MSANRYNRWQGLAIAQLSVAVALISGLSVAGLGAGLSLLKLDRFPVQGCWRIAFAASQLLFLAAAFFSCSAVITRLLDFRLTARSVRKQERPEYARSLTIFGCNAEEYGRGTWRLFWFSYAFLTVGAILFTVSVGVAYLDKLR